MSDVRRNLLADFDAAYDYEFSYDDEYLYETEFEGYDDERRQLFDIVTFCLPVTDIEEKECPICLENIPRAEMVMTNCHHHVCFECMQQHLKALDESRNLPCCSLCRAEFMFIELPDENKCVVLEQILRKK